MAQKRVSNRAQSHNSKGLEGRKKALRKRLKKPDKFNAKANIKKLNFQEFAKRLIEHRFKVKLDQRESGYCLKQLEKRIRHQLSLRKLYTGVDNPTVYKAEVNKYFYQMVAYYPLFDIKKGFIKPSYMAYNFEKLTVRIAKEYNEYIQAKQVGEGRAYHILKDKQVREIVNANNGVLIN